VGTIQSIEHTLRALDKAKTDEEARLERSQKMLADYREQLGKPFEHEERLRELLARQAEVDAALDLDKGEQQAAAPEAGDTAVEPGNAHQPAPQPAFRSPRIRPGHEPPDGDETSDVDDKEPETVLQRGPPTAGQFREVDWEAVCRSVMTGSLRLSCTGP